MIKFTSYFVGIPLNEQVQNEFENLLKAINKIDPSLEIVFADTPHITVYYLDKQAQNNLEEITEIIKQHTHVLSGCQLKIGGMDTFGEDKPRVLFLQVEYTPALKEFNKVLSERLKKFIAFDDELPFHPHITVARFKTKKTQIAWGKVKGSLGIVMEKINWQFPVTEVVIYGAGSTKTPQYQEKLIYIPV